MIWALLYFVHSGGGEAFWEGRNAWIRGSCSLFLYSDVYEGSFSRSYAGGSVSMMIVWD